MKKICQRHENSNDYANQRKEAVPQFLVIVSNAIKQQVVPPQNESSSNRFVNDLVTSLRESHSSDDFNGTEVIHVKPKIVKEIISLFVAPIRDARHDIVNQGQQPIYVAVFAGWEQIGMGIEHQHPASFFLVLQLGNVDAGAFFCKSDIHYHVVAFFVPTLNGKRFFRHGIKTTVYQLLWSLIFE
jgi:hypothetical protein